ncbi:MAG: SHOCT domain-containing protein [Lachnospiraceae bacterium]|nr:SHOCT domain-containing protein [Lachnospiraceae bacterium]
MAEILSYLDEIPALVQELLDSYLPFVIAFAVIFLIGCIGLKRLGRICRFAVVLILAVCGIVGFYEHRYAAALLSVILLAGFIVICILIALITGSIRSHSDAKIEKRALAEAAKRRRSLSRESSRANVSSESLPASRTQAENVLQELQDLRDKGILTEEEFAQKRQEVYEKLG